MKMRERVVLQVGTLYYRRTSDLVFIEPVFRGVPGVTKRTSKKIMEN
jgi:hypothetical protein